MPFKTPPAIAVPLSHIILRHLIRADVTLICSEKYCSASALCAMRHDIEQLMKGQTAIYANYVTSNLTLDPPTRNQKLDMQSPSALLV